MSLDTETYPDRRLFERFPSRFPAKYKDARENFGTNVSLRDASAQGVKIITKEQCYLNDSLTLEIELPDGLHPMNIKGQVVWIRNPEPHVWDVGLRFNKINLVRMSRLYKFSAPPSST